MIGLREQIRKTQSASLPGLEFFGADFRGADLADLKLASTSLRGIVLDEADLSGAQFIQVDLTGASLDGANLEGSSFQLVNGTSASLAGARCKDSYWTQSDLTGAKLARADFNNALLRGCGLERAQFEDANLYRTKLVTSNCSDATFRSATFNWVNTSGSIFDGADFTGARNFFPCREIIVEILRRETGGDLERLKVVGAVAVGVGLCYGEWQRLLDKQPEYREIALKIFERYPESGFSEALRIGWNPVQSPATLVE